MSGLNTQRGSILGSMLVVLALVSILTLSVLRMVALRTGAARRIVYRLQARYAAESGVAKARWYLTAGGGSDLEYPVGLEENLIPGVRYRLEIRPYGGFLEVTSRGFCAKQTVTVRALLAMQPPAWFKRALTLRDSSYPLVMAGASHIRGDVLVGPAGIRAAHLPPGRARRHELVDGSLVEDPVVWPTLDARLLTETMDRLDARLEEQGAGYGPEDLGYGRSILTPQSWVDGLGSRRAVVRLAMPLVTITAGASDPSLRAPLTLVVTGSLRLCGALRLEGPIVLVAGDSIRVEEGVEIRGGLLYARGSIQLEGSTRLEGQALSRSQIRVRDQAQVLYPGLLYATGTPRNNRLQGGIEVTSRMLQTGSLVVHSSVALAQHPGLVDETRIRISRESRVAGLVYSTSATWLTGTVIGSVVTGSFYLEQPPTTYVNWINDGVIDRWGLATAYRLPLLFAERGDLEVVSWEWYGE